jgi:hypothetical protein
VLQIETRFGAPTGKNFSCDTFYLHNTAVISKPTPFPLSLNLLLGVVSFFLFVHDGCLCTRFYKKMGCVGELCYCIELWIGEGLKKR